MATFPTAQHTDFSRDVMGRFLCHGFDEAQKSGLWDVIIIGGGTYSGVLAQHLYTRSHPDSTGLGPARPPRILVLEAGPFVLPAHLQNVGEFDVYPPGDGSPPNDPSSIEELRLRGVTGSRKEIWGIPWHSNSATPGLAYCIGGRAIAWGGWSPQFLDSEMPTTSGAAPWPAAVVQDLTDRFFREANQQIGTNDQNDFLNGPMHFALLEKLHDSIHSGSIDNVVPFADIPLQATDPEVTGENDADRQRKEELRKLEAPMAVQSRTRPGFFPFNKFSSIPLLIAASRADNGVAGLDLTNRRLMIVPHCHVMGLEVEPVRLATDAIVHRVIKVKTEYDKSVGALQLSDRAVVILAMGTVESTRLALLALEGKGVPNYPQIGQNLQVHTRNNYFMSVPKETIRRDFPANLQASALHVSGRITHSEGAPGHFHVQVTASGRPMGGGGDEELFKFTPDLDALDRFRREQDTHVAIALRGCGEMQPMNPRSAVEIDPNRDLDEFGVPRAFVRLNDNPSDPPAQWKLDGKEKLSAKDKAVYETMTDMIEQLANVFDPNHGFKRGDVSFDGIGTTYHEAGTLWMGEDPQASVTNSDGRFHYVTNLYAGDMAAAPSSGSANPMLIGVALARRLAKHLAPEGDGGKTSAQSPRVDIPSIRAIQFLTGNSVAIFDGTTTANWRMSGRGQFFVADGALQSVGDDDIGLLWCTVPTPPDYVFRLEWLLAPVDPSNGVFVDNSGVFVRFPHPDSRGYHKPPFVAVNEGFEIQLDPQGRDPVGMSQGAQSIYGTGAIYGIQPPQQLVGAPSGQWHSMEIRVQRQQYRVTLNGTLITEFANTDPSRGRPSADNRPSFIGLQVYGGSKAAFRNMEITQL
jgi:hypothetical protein